MFPADVNPKLPILLFKLFDRDGVGSIDWRALMLAVGKQRSDVPPEDAFNLAFEIFDKVCFCTF